MRPDLPAFSAHFGATLALAVTVAATTALAASGQRPSGRFDDLIAELLEKTKLLLVIIISIWCWWTGWCWWWPPTTW